MSAERVAELLHEAAELVALDSEFASERRDFAWGPFYASRLIERLAR